MKQERPIQEDRMRSEVRFEDHSFLLCNEYPHHCQATVQNMALRQRMIITTATIEATRRRVMQLVPEGLGGTRKGHTGVHPQSARMG